MHSCSLFRQILLSYYARPHAVLPMYSCPYYAAKGDWYSRMFFILTQSPKLCGDC